MRRRGEEENRRAGGMKRVSSHFIASRSANSPFYVVAETRQCQTNWTSGEERGVFVFSPSEAGQRETREAH